MGSDHDLTFPLNVRGNGLPPLEQIFIFFRIALLSGLKNAIVFTCVEGFRSRTGPWKSTAVLCQNLFVTISQKDILHDESLKSTNVKNI